MSADNELDYLPELEKRRRGSTLSSVRSVPITHILNLPVSRPFSAWENIDAHRKFIAHPDYQTVQANFASLFKDDIEGPTALHTHFDLDPLPKFVAPITEHAFLSPSNGVTLDELTSALLLARERLLAKHKDDSVMVYGSSYGTMEERPNQLVTIIGWESLEVRTTHVQKLSDTTGTYFL